MKQIFKQSVGEFIKVADAVIPYHWNIIIYITEQMPSTLFVRTFHQSYHAWF
jgi:hypothetical protein